MISRRAFVGGSVAATTLFIAGCRAPEPRHIRVGYLPISESLPLFMAQRQGYFERAQLSVELLSLDGGAMIISGMAGGSLDFGVSNYVSQMLARESGLDIRLVSGATVETRANPQHALMVRQDSSLRPGDLAGKKIAVNTRRNINELFMRAYLSQSGVDPNSVDYVELPFPRMLSALESRAVDAVGVIEPFVTFGTRSRIAKPIARFVVDVEDRIPVTGWMAPADYIRRNPQIAVQFRQAIQQAIEQISLNPSEARSLLPTFTRLTQEDAAAIPLPTFTPDTPPPTFGALLRRVRQAGWITERAMRLQDYVFVA